MKCENCVNSRMILSENGQHYICCLSAKKAKECLMDSRHFDSIIKDDEIDCTN